MTRPTLTSAIAATTALLVTLAGGGAVSAAVSQESARRDGTSELAGTLRTYCYTCHNERVLAGGLVLEGRSPDDDIGANPEVWEKVLRKLRTHTMPPQGSPRPDAPTYERVAGWLAGELDRTAVPNPGRPALRRLNRAEYGNAIRDLLGLDVNVGTLLPPDDSAFGFDNIGELLGVSPTLLERYLAAADQVSALAMGDPATAPGSTTYTLRGDESQDLHQEGLPLGTVGGLVVDHNFPLDGEYEFRLSLFRNNLEIIRGLEHTHDVEITVDGERILLGTVGGDENAPSPDGTVAEQSDEVAARLRVRVPVRAGPHQVTAAFIRKLGFGTNRLRPFDRSNSDTYDSTGRPHIETLAVTGPFLPMGPGETPSRERILTCRPDGPAEESTCAREILSDLARRAYRRPVGDADLDRLMPFYFEGREKGTFETGIQLALRRMLASPTFVFRIEEDPGNLAPGTAYRVSDPELATRLSFFLWSSLPDDELIDLASADRLHLPGVLASQVDRMLGDPRSWGLVENFAGQWLHLRNLRNINPNSDLFPDFDNDLREAFREEAELFFASIFDEDRSVLDLLTADYTFVDERLARHYGIPNVYGSQFRRVTLGPGLDARRGLLGKGGILMATSHADRTAPTLRGKWVLENLIGMPPPPPPAVVPPLEDTPRAAPRTMRERMEGHRATPACAGCHQLIDPLGFAMENFDAIGRWRTFEAGAPIDASGQMADGRPLDGVKDLREALLANETLFVQTFTEKLLTYALGRGLEHYDMPVVRGIMGRTEPEDFRLRAIVLGIVTSDPFQMRVKPGATVLE